MSAQHIGEIRSESKQNASSAQGPLIYEQCKLQLSGSHAFLKKASATGMRAHTQT